MQNSLKRQSAIEMQNVPSCKIELLAFWALRDGSLELDLLIFILFID